MRTFADPLNAGCSSGDLQNSKCYEVAGLPHLHKMLGIDRTLTPELTVLSKTMLLMEEQHISTMVVSSPTYNKL